MSANTVSAAAVAVLLLAWPAMVQQAGRRIRTIQQTPLPHRAARRSRPVCRRAGHACPSPAGGMGMMGDGSPGRHAHDDGR